MMTADVIKSTQHAIFPANHNQWLSCNLATKVLSGGCRLLDTSGELPAASEYRILF
jgi:hypothetical protein